MIYCLQRSKAGEHMLGLLIWHGLMVLTYCLDKYIKVIHIY